jgi:hypothetical protein
MAEDRIGRTAELPPSCLSNHDFAKNLENPQNPAQSAVGSGV